MGFLRQHLDWAYKVVAHVSINHRLVIWMLAVILALVTFWMVDLPQTLRLKAAIVNLMPISAEAKLSAVRSLCAGIFPGDALAAVGCWLRFQSEEAANEVEKQRQCNEFKKATMTGAQAKDWWKGELGFVYVGDNDYYNGYVFYPDKCIFVHMRNGSTMSFRGRD